MKKIIFTGGGTAGHIIPNLAIIDELKNYQIFYLGSSGMEKDIIKNYPSIKFIEIPAVKFKRNLSPSNLLIPFRLLSSINKTKQIIKEINPSLIFSKGGYVSIPTCIAANKLDIPVITHESDLSIGLGNKIIAKKAKYLCCSFKNTAKNYKRNAIFTGSPIRKKILEGNKEIVKNRHNIKSSKPIIMIVGGSLGARAINETIWNNIEKLTHKYTIIHIVGKKNINEKIQNQNYIQIEFVNDIENYFALVDLVISRAGSNTIFELLSIHKPMILIPLPKNSNSRGDQVDNTKYFVENNFANFIYQESLNIDTLLTTIEETLKNKDSYISSMKESKEINGNKNIIGLIEKTIKLS